MGSLLNIGRPAIVALLVLLVAVVVERLNLVEQRLRAKVPDVRLLEHQALVVERLQVILFVLQNN